MENTAREETNKEHQKRKTFAEKLRSPGRNIAELRTAVPSRHVVTFFPKENNKIESSEDTKTAIMSNMAPARETNDPKSQEDMQQRSPNRDNDERRHGTSAKQREAPGRKPSNRTPREKETANDSIRRTNEHQQKGFPSCTKTTEPRRNGQRKIQR